MLGAQIYSVRTTGSEPASEEANMTRPKPAATRQGRSSTVPDFRPNPAPVSIPCPPSSLKGYGIRLWNQIWEAGKNAYQPATDSLIIERYCQLQERRQELLALIEADGWVTTGSQNQMVSHPAAKLLDSIEGRLGPIEDRIACNPEARLRLGITSVEHNTKLERFLDKGGSY